MKDFLIGNWFLVILVLLFVGYEIYLVSTRQWTKLRMQAYALMLTAERMFGSGEGKKKFEVVFERLYFNLIPAWVRWFITPTYMRAKIQKWYNLAKDYLDNGKVDNSNN